jgi:hypothetical protein
LASEEVLTAVKTLMAVFWDVTLWGLVGWYQRFGGTYRLHHQGEVSVMNMEAILHKLTAYVGLKTWFTVDLKFYVSANPFECNGIQLNSYAIHVFTNQ